MKLYTAGQCVKVYPDYGDPFEGIAFAEENNGLVSVLHETLEGRQQFTWYPIRHVFRLEDIGKASIHTNSLIPRLMVWFKHAEGRGTDAVTLGPFVFLRGEAKASTVRHELIHVLQGRETLFVGLFVLYALSFMYYLVKHRSVQRAYHATPFEVEAHRYDNTPGYLSLRRRYEWLR